MSSVVDPVLGDVVAGTAKEKLASKVGELTATDHQNLLSTYIESQRAAITRASEEAQLQFLLHGKPRLRQHVPSDAEAAPGEDRRVTRALAALDKIRSQRGGVNGRQYSESLAGWTHNLAQTRLGRVNGGFFDQPGTNLAKDDSDTVGVLYLEVEGTSPDKKVKVTEAQIEGLSPIVRQKLMKEDPQLRDLDFAIVAELDVDDGDIEIGRNEVNQDFEIDCDNEGRQWLTARHAHEQGLLPDTGTVPTVKGGIRSVMDDVGGTKLSKVPGGLQS